MAIAVCIYVNVTLMSLLKRMYTFGLWAYISGKSLVPILQL